MIVDPFDSRQGIAPSGLPAAQVHFLPVGSSPFADLTDDTFVGLADPAEIFSHEDDAT